MNLKAIVVFLTLALSGCAYVDPLLQEFNVISVPQEKEIGDKIAAEVLQEMRIVDDPNLISRVRDLGERLESALPAHPFDYQFYVVDESSPNAFTIPGGRIYVHTGLFQFVDDDYQLAGILAHEIGHMYERHPAKSLSRAYGLESLAGLVFKDNPKLVQNIAVQFAGGGFLNYFSREDELKADTVSYYLTKRAGYPTDGLLRFLIKLNQMQARGLNIPFMSTHPPTLERIRRLEALERTGGQSATVVPTQRV